MLEKMYTANELKSEVLGNLRQKEELHDSDLLWRINMMLHRKVVKKTDLLQLIKESLTKIGQQSV